jgi:hypothetical protein
MQESFRNFMTELIDYAGLFPPAKLPLEEALANYLAYKQSDDAWMLSRFIIPAQQLEALSALLGGQAISLSVLGQSGQSADDFLAKLEGNMTKLKIFRQKHPQTETEFFELRLPIGFVTEELLEQAKAILGADMTVFYELPVTEIASLPTLARFQEKNGFLGVKLRCGGEVAEAFPSVEAIAAFIVACRDNGLALKATAGLHHPIRQFNTTVQAYMHGFLNVFGAGLLAEVHALDADALVPMLADENASDFNFNDEYFAWKDLRISTDDIEKYRSKMLISYGSCSFDEPREDLAALNLLESVAK